MTRVFREIEGRIEKEPAARAYKKAFLDDRNHRMVERLVPLLERGKAFVAVGAAHLPGEEGMLHLLEQQGYRITRVYRSEEHTSELQSLMRISYAVFCLQKKH